jgi:hypothetical protein
VDLLQGDIWSLHEAVLVSDWRELAVVTEEEGGSAEAEKVIVVLVGNHRGLIDHDRLDARKYRAQHLCPRPAFAAVLPPLMTVGLLLALALRFPLESRAGSAVERNCLEDQLIDGRCANSFRSLLVRLLAARPV